VLLRFSMTNLEEEILLENVEKLFKGINSNNLKRLRLKIDLFAEDFHFSAISTWTIVDTGSKDIGAMDIIDAHSLLSCVRGSRTIMKISEYSFWFHYSKYSLLT